MQTALIVDDEPHIRDWLDHFLQERGFRTHVCGGVRAAFSEMSTMCFDLVLTDYNMPDGTGGAVLECAKVRCPAAMRVLMTGALSTVPEWAQKMAHHCYEKINLAAELHELIERFPGKKSADTGSSQITEARAG